jgi:hypothetical protein
MSVEELLGDEVAHPLFSREIRRIFFLFTTPLGFTFPLIKGSSGCIHHYHLSTDTIMFVSHSR